MRIQPSPSAVIRKGFTIVELLVALALVLFIMSIISQVFVDSSEAFRSQRSKAELSEKLRFITQTIRADLRGNHFEANRRISDDDFWLDGPPKVGYFRIEQSHPYEVKLGAFNETIFSFPNSTIPNQNNVDQNTLLAFTTFLGGKDPRGYHSTSFNSVPANVEFVKFLGWKNNFLNPADSRYEENTNIFNSPDAEVAWFLGPTNSNPLNFDSKEYVLQDEIGTPSVRTYSLYRRVWPLLPQEISALVDNDPQTISLSPAQLGQKVSVVQLNAAGVPLNPPVQFNYDSALQGPNVDVPNRRALALGIPNSTDLQAWKAASYSGNQAKGKDYLIADNVLSFTVEVCPEPLPGQPPTFLPLNQVFGNNLSSAVFDTWCQRNSDPQRGIPGDFSTKIVLAPGQTGWNIPGSTTGIPMLDGKQFGELPRKLIAIRVTIRLFDTNNVLSPSKTTWQATVVEPL